MRIHKAMTFCVFCISFSTIVFSFPNYGSSPHAWAASEVELMEGVKKEGKVVWYTSIPSDANVALVRAFEKKYAFSKVDVYRTNNPGLLNRVENEARAGKHLWDVISTAGFQTYTLKKRNFLAKYISPEATAVPEKFKDPNGYWTTIYQLPLVFAYNTNLVSSKDIPQSYGDLLDPKWKGKMALDAKDVEWFANILKIRGEKEGQEYMRKLATQDLRLVEGHSLQTQLMAAGEFASAVNVYIHVIEKIKEQGAPVDWVPFDPVVTYVHAGSLSANSLHPHGAKLLLDFLLSKEGQGVLASFSSVVIRSDVPLRSSRPVKGIRFWPSDMTMAESYNKYLNQFREIFLKGER